MEFRDLKAQYKAIKNDMDAGIAEVINSAKFISGPQVKELEKQLANYVGTKHCVTCANGTDAITLALMTWDVGPGDAVFVPDFTFFSSGECPAFEGATPVFVDVDPRTYNMDPEKLESAVIKVKSEGKYIPKVVIAVDLFGLPADYEAIQDICKKYDLLLLEDAAQGFGGSIRVPEEVDLEQYHMAYWLKQQEENGIVYQNLDLSDDFESISTYNSRASYDRYSFHKIEDPDIRIFMHDVLWVEKNGKDGIEVVEQKEYNLSDLSFEKTENGYLVTFPDYEHVFGFAIYADEGSEFLKHEYHSHEDREAYLSPGSKIGGDKYFEYDLYWKEVGGDGYLLTDEDGYQKMFYGGEELIPRIR